MERENDRAANRFVLRFCREEYYRTRALAEAAIRDATFLYRVEAVEEPEDRQLLAARARQLMVDMRFAGGQAHMDNTNRHRMSGVSLVVDDFEITVSVVRRP